MAASAACIFHCLGLPILLSLVPVLAAYIALPEAFHAWAFLVAVPTSAAAVLFGCRRHGRSGPALLAVPGLMMLGGGVLAPEGRAEILLSVGGATLLALAHLMNLRCLRASSYAGCT